MAVTYRHTKDGRFLISREFMTLAAAARGAAALEEVSDSGFQPAPVIEFEADPVLQALIERSDEEAPVEGLNFDKAHDPDAYAAATAAQRETGD